jgi:hypothetical protein
MAMLGNFLHGWNFPNTNVYVVYAIKVKERDRTTNCLLKSNFVAGKSELTSQVGVKCNPQFPLGTYLFSF